MSDETIVLCDDCGAKSEQPDETSDECPICGSYNCTVVDD